jgi:hypothetical protein
VTKLKGVRVILLISTILLTGVVLAFASCAPATAPAKLELEPERMLPVVSVIPNVGGPTASVSYVGANFKPGEKVKVAVGLRPGEEHSPGASGEGLAVEVNELGCFMLTGTSVWLPPLPGVYPVRVYDEKGKMVACTVVLVVEEEK